MPPIADQLNVGRKVSVGRVDTVELTVLVTKCAESHKPSLL